jgi:hypothetical protein
MIKFDRFLFNSLFGLVIPILCFLIFWWSSLLFTNDDKYIIIAAPTGFGVGLMISLFLKLTRKPDIYRLSKPILIMIYLFYNVGMFGFFMGVPVFHLILGVIAGFYWTKRLIHHNAAIVYKAEINRISRFTSIVIGFVCLFSAIFALISKSTPSDLKQMFHLPFDISQPLLISLIITGGLFLIFAQYFFTQITMKKILKINNINVC